MMKKTWINWENKIKHPVKGRLTDEVNATYLTRLEKDEITRGK